MTSSNPEPVSAALTGILREDMNVDIRRDDRVTTWTAEAEETERFPRKLIDTWVSQAFSPPNGRLANRLRRRDPTTPSLRASAIGIGVGVGLHDSAIAILRRFGKSDYLRNIAEQAIRGEAVLCIGASEQSGGSDLQIVGTEVRSVRDGFEVKGIKKSSRCPPSPTMSWRWPATSTTTRTASTAAWS